MDSEGKRIHGFQWKVKKKMLGELYNPKGLALETAKAVLEVEHPLAVNVALGCTNNCSYCYVPLSTKTPKGKMRLPKQSPKELVKKQIEKHLAKHPLALLNQFIEGVFISFCTDPFLPENRQNTDDLIHYLQWEQPHRPKIATLSKMGVSMENIGLLHGVTLVSLDEKFHETFEPRALPPNDRLRALCYANRKGDDTWISLEPYPCSAIWKQSLSKLLEEIVFWAKPSLIIFGKWNYDKRANTEEAKKEYGEYIETLTDFCTGHHIRLHVKSETLEFASKEFPKV